MLWNECSNFIASFKYQGAFATVMDKKLIGILGIIFVISGITGTIPSALNKFIIGLGGFGTLSIIGIIMAIYGFSD